MNVEKVVVVSEGDIIDLRDEEIDFNEPAENNRTENQVNSDISEVGFHFGKYLLTQKNNCAPSSEAYKYVYSLCHNLERYFPNMES